MFGQNDNINLEFNEKKTLFLKLFGNVYIIILAVIVGLGIIYLNKIEKFSSEKIVPLKVNRPQNMDTDIVMLKGPISQPVDVKKFGNSTPELIEKGKTLFATNCASCHGNDGKGDGVAGVTLNPKPRNFHELTSWKNGINLSQIFKTLQDGLAATNMPSFSTIPVEDRFALIHYIQSLNTGYPKPNDAEFNELDKTYSLSTGTKLPNHIPVKTAKEKIVNETSSEFEKIKNIVNTVEKDNTDAALVFKKISIDLQKAVSTLMSDTKWYDNETEFTKILTTGSIVNGFNTKVYSLTQQQLTALYQYSKILITSNIEVSNKPS